MRPEEGETVAAPPGSDTGAHARARGDHGRGCGARCGGGLQAGYLPVLETAYTDASGAHYRQESFVGRVPGPYGARSVVSFVRLSIDARRSKRGATIRLVPWRRLAHSAPDRFALRGQTRLI